MIRDSLRRILPHPSRFRERSHLRHFGRLLNNHNLWHLRRDSVALSVSVGLFIAFIPVPIQMLLAAVAAIILGCNLPIAVTMVLITNPITIPPMFYAAYKVGAALLDQTPRVMAFEGSIDWMLAVLADVWQPLLLGCAILGFASAAIGNVAVRVIWRVAVARRWRARQLAQKLAKNKGSVRKTLTPRPSR